MRTVKSLSFIFIAAALVACGDDGGGTTPDAKPATPDAAAGFPQPSGTVPVNFTVDDTANKVYAAGDLEWKGSMMYTTATRIVTKDDTWTGPYAPLYDDGPWTAGGHEPAGATAGDHKWGVTVFITPPATGSTTYAYGLIDRSYETKYGNGWIWPPPDGNFVVNAGSAGSTAITAPGTTIPAYGTTDLQLKIDLNNLAPGTWDKTKVGVKGSAWAWGVQDITSKISNNVATFTLSEYVGAGKPFNHTGLLKAGDKPEWIFTFGATNTEYSMDKVAFTTGVTAATKASGAAAFTPATIQLKETGDKNSYITVP